MDTDRNLLFGALCLQMNLISPQQFVDACTMWNDQKERGFANILIERGWLLESDRRHLEYLVNRKRYLHGSDARVSSGSTRNSVLKSHNPEIEPSLPEPSDLRSAEIDETSIFRGQSIDERYELTRLHATGGIGRVWLAHDKELGREVALKELRPDRMADPNLKKRFLREARTTGQLEHPGVVPVYELANVDANQEPFYTMRFVKGRTLAQAVHGYHESKTNKSENTFDLVTLLNAFVAVCKTVAYSHSRGIVHRDLKGQNVILGDFGEVVVLDWGLAKRLSTNSVESLEPIPDVDKESTDHTLTHEGEMVGTPAYMAPEQVAGRNNQIDQRTDVYGLGAMLYEILTGRPVFCSQHQRSIAEDSARRTGVTKATQ